MCLGNFLSRDNQLDLNFQQPLKKKKNIKDISPKVTFS